jgi:hypothetical protein
MAILEDFPSIEATVRVGGEALAEYDDDEEYEPQGDDVPQYRRAEVVSKYIESETGAEFTINVSLGEPYEMDCPSLGFHILVDGVSTKHCVLRNLDYSPRTGFEKEFKGSTIRDVVEMTKRTQNFTFANLETSCFINTLLLLLSCGVKCLVNGIGTSTFFRIGSWNSSAFGNTITLQVSASSIHSLSQVPRSKFRLEFSSELTI